MLETLRQSFKGSELVPVVDKAVSSWEKVSTNDQLALVKSNKNIFLLYFT